MGGVYGVAPDEFRGEFTLSEKEVLKQMDGLRQKIAAQQDKMFSPPQEEELDSAVNKIVASMKGDFEDKSFDRILFICKEYVSQLSDIEQSLLTLYSDPQSQSARIQEVCTSLDEERVNLANRERKIEQNLDEALEFVEESIAFLIEDPSQLTLLEDVADWVPIEAASSEESYPIEGWGETSKDLFDALVAFTENQARPLITEKEHPLTVEFVDAYHRVQQGETGAVDYLKESASRWYVAYSKSKLARLEKEAEPFIQNVDKSMDKQEEEILQKYNADKLMNWAGIDPKVMMMRVPDKRSIRHIGARLLETAGVRLPGDLANLKNDYLEYYKLSVKKYEKLLPISNIKIEIHEIEKQKSDPLGELELSFENRRLHQEMADSLKKVYAGEGREPTPEIARYEEPIAALSREIEDLITNHIKTNDFQSLNFSSAFESTIRSENLLNNEKDRIHKLYSTKIEKYPEEVAQYYKKIEKIEGDLEGAKGILFRQLYSSLEALLEFASATKIGLSSQTKQPKTTTKFSKTH